MPDGERSMEARIEELVRLEEELTSNEQSGADDDRVYTEGTIAGATKVPVEAVPDDYPVAIETDQALRVDVDVGDGTVPTYMEWDVGGTGQGHVERLLDVLDRGPGEFADVFGDRVALDRREGHYGIHADRTAAIHGAEAAREDSGVRQHGLLVAGLLGVSLLGAALWEVGATEVGSSLTWLPYLLIPLAINADLGRIQEYFDWEPNRWLWPWGSLVPVFHLPVAAGYLVERWVRLRTPGDVGPSTHWHRAVVGGTAAATLAIPAGAVQNGVSLLYFFAAGFLPLAIYFDGRRLAEVADWPADPSDLATKTLIACVFALGPVVGAWYLLKRREKVGSRS